MRQTGRLLDVTSTSAVKMASLYSAGDADYHPASKRPRVQFESSSPSSMDPTTPSFDLPMANHSFTNIKEFQRIIAEKNATIDESDEGQYLTFNKVSPGTFQKIETSRREGDSGIRFTYFADVEVLIVKVVTIAHEKAHRSLGARITMKSLSGMNMGFDEFMEHGAAKYNGPNSSKEGDSVYINQRVRSQAGDWPSLVIESGKSESLLRLRVDARWWIQNSNGQVNIVIIIHVNPADKKIQIEKWISGSSAGTRVSPRLTQAVFPTRTAQISIDQSATPFITTGAPLVLEFDKVFCRQPVTPLEQDIIFTQQELEQWAQMLWVGI